MKHFENRPQRALICLLIVLIVGGGAWLAIVKRRANSERSAVLALTELDPKLTVEYDDRDVPPSLRRMAGKIIGDDVFSKVVGLKLFGIQVNDRAMSEVDLLPDLRRLTLASTSVSDDGLAHLRNHPTISELDISHPNASVTDDGARVLLDLPQLEVLALDGCDISDKSMAVIGSLTNLRGLSFTGTRITDAGLRQLTGLKRLEQIDLSNTNVSDLGLEDLAKLQQLISIKIERTSVGDAGMKHLASMPSLAGLNIFQTKVTDVGLEELARLKSLKWLFVTPSEDLTESGCRTLHASLPDLHIHASFPAMP